MENHGKNQHPLKSHLQLWCMIKSPAARGYQRVFFTKFSWARKTYHVKASLPSKMAVLAIETCEFYIPGGSNHQ